MAKHLTLNVYVDTEADEPSLWRLDRTDKFNQHWIRLQFNLTDTKIVIVVPTNNNLIVSNNQDNNFNGFRLPKLDNARVNHNATDDMYHMTKVYAVVFHKEIERSQRFIGLDYYDESKDLVKNN